MSTRGPHPFNVGALPRPTPPRKLSPLGECIELTAAFNVLGQSPYLSDVAGFKRKLLRTARRDLHGAVARIVATIPSRRYV